MRRAKWMAMALGAIAIGALCAPEARSQSESEDFISRARALFEESPLIDGHNDVPWQYRTRADNHLGELDLASDLSRLDPPMHTDLKRLEAGGLGAQFWSVYIPVSFGGAEGVLAVIEQIDLAHRMIERYPEAFELALSAADIERIHAGGKIASLLGMEGGHSIGNSLAALRMTYDLGARYMTLTHSANVDWADACTDEPAVGGLSRFGVEVVREMNRLGMLVDLSHVAPATMHDALDASEAPVIFSHSSARGVADHVRNVPDDVLARLPEKDAVVMVTFVPDFINERLREYSVAARERMSRLREQHGDEREKIAREMEIWRAENPAPKATLGDVADHIDHIRDKIGVDYIGIGGDFDGIRSTPVGLESVADYPKLFAELLRRGYSEADLKKIAGQNLLRVFRKAEIVAARLRAERPPSDKLIEELDGPGAKTERTKRQER